MPIYDYRCKKCREEFEQYRGINDSDADVACPGCGEKNPQRVLSSFYSKCSLNKGNLRIPT